MSETTVRDAVFHLLREFGMTTVFGNPGSTELPMFKGFPDDFRYVLALQESIALGMADGFAQATRGAAVVNLHSAVGTGHALGNLFTAFRNRTPIVVIAGQQARSILPYQPFLYAEQATEAESDAGGGLRRLRRGRAVGDGRVRPAAPRAATGAPRRQRRVTPSRAARTGPGRAR